MHKTGRHKTGMHKAAGILRRTGFATGWVDIRFSAIGACPNRYADGDSGCG
jgi:hypothetical protein